MSQTKKYKFYLICLISLVCFFMFGCKNETPVEDISFKLDNGEQIVLFVGQTLDMGDYVEIKPSYASNKSYTITSFNENVVRVENNKLIAVKEDKAVIKVVSNSNPMREDMMTVVVKSTQEQLLAPLNLEYDSLNQVFRFDPVLYAASYTLKINGVNIELGNSTVYNMSNYAGPIFDRLMIAQVRANAPDYTFAVTTSDFSAEKKVYQAGASSNLRINGGTLAFDKFATSSLNNVYVDGSLLAENVVENYVSLAYLDEKYAGQTLNVGVQSVVSNEIKQQYGNNVDYFDSVMQSTVVHVLDVPDLTMSASQITWQNVSHAGGYCVYVDGAKKAETNNNYFDLKGLEDYNSIITPGIVHSVKVVPILADVSIGVGRTIKENEIRVQRLGQTNIRCEGTDVVWDEIENASLYAISMEGQDLNLDSSTSLTKISMKNRAAGRYKIYVTAIAQELPSADGVHFLSSKVSDKEFVKHQMLDAVIENFVLKINNLETGVVKIDVDDDALDKTESGVEGKTDYLDLGDHQFAAGPHSVILTRLGDNNSVESDPFTIDFIQLEKIDTITISESVVSVVRSENNESATIKLITTGGSLSNDIIINGTNYAYNINNPDLDNYLSSGKYHTCVKVVGNESTTFSYREGGEIVDCATVEFEVLPIPTLSVESSADTQFTISGSENAESFDVYNVNNDDYIFDSNINSRQFNDFSVGAGETTCFAVRAVGDGSHYLDSWMSSTIQITRLETPSLAYNNVTNVISKTDVKPKDFVLEYIFTHNGEIVNYDYTSEFTMANNDVGNVFTIKAVAKIGGEGAFYLDSFVSEALMLTQISNETNISLSGLQNNLVISPIGHIEQYDIVVEFDLESGNQTFTTQVRDGKNYLSNGLSGADEIVLDYVYSSGKYVITLIDVNHNAIMEDLNSEFAVRVRYVKPSTGNDLLINSEFSETATLNLNIIDATSTITTNLQNQIVVTPSNHTQEFGVIGIAQTTSNFAYIVESNGEGQLVCNKWIYNGVVENNPYPAGLNYTYRDGSYYIDLLDENNEYIIPGINSSLTVKIKYSFDHNAYVHDGKKTDLDSEFTSEKVISIQPETNISRDGQALKIFNVKETYNYLDYTLLVNNYKLSLDTTAVSVDGYIVVDVDYIFNNTPPANLSTNNKIEVLVRNNETSEVNPILSRKSGEIWIARTNPITISSYKYNNNEDSKNNNSTVVLFNVEETSYSRQYVLDFYDQTSTCVHTMIFINTDAVDGVIEFNMDDISALDEVMGNITIVATVKTEGKEDEVEMFDSVLSNSIVLNKISAASGLKVSNSTLTFNSVPNAVGYEIWEVSGTGKTKFSTHLVAGNSYEITGISGQKQLVVKAISSTVGFTNSTFSEVITINKIASPEIVAVNGKFNVKFSPIIISLLMNNKINIMPIVSNSSTAGISFNLNSIDGEEMKFEVVGFTPTLIAEPYLFLSYNSASFMAETLKLKIQITQSEAINGVYYLNSDEVSVDCYGLFAPTEIKKTTDENNAVEMISWTPSDKNILNGSAVSAGYIFKIEYFDGAETYTYYSDDADLKYLNDGNLVSYPTFIAGKNAIFPAGYGLNDDGTLKVKFGAGTYKVSVQAVPTSAISGYNLLSSKYSEYCEFEIMQASTLSVVDGKVSWDAQPKADHYVVSIYEQNGTTPVLIDTAPSTNTTYDFTNSALNELNGVYKVVVKAISKRDDTLNSADSEPLYVYRLPQASAVSVDDGYFVFSATTFFNLATIEFVDTKSSSRYVLNLNNEGPAALQLSLLGETDWSTFVNNSVVNTPQKYILDLNDDVLKILDGRDYTINVTLYGNTHATLGMITSSKVINLSSMTTTKLKPNAVEVSKGVVQFAPNAAYATITEGVYSSVLDLNYSFNNTVSSNFWHNTAVYKIVVTTSTGPQTVYAVDYYSLTTAIANGTIDASEYKLITSDNGLYAWVIYSYLEGDVTKELYFNVFTENKIDLRKYDILPRYTITEEILNGTVKLDCEDLGEDDDITLIGTITIDIYMLGGDSYTSAGKLISHMTAETNVLNAFEKYDGNTLNTKDGKVKFDNLQPVVDGIVIDNPVYKIEVSLFNSVEKTLFYIYYTTEEEARSIAMRHDSSTYSSATYLKIGNEEGTVYLDENLVIFDLTQYLAQGTYKASIRTLAGMGVGSINAADYYVNAKQPEDNYPLFKLSDTEFISSEGVLQFAQSYIVDSGKKIPYNLYEITLLDADGANFLTYNITDSETAKTLPEDLIVATEGITIENGVVKYVLPSQIGDFKLLGGTVFNIKVRGISTENYILNGTYKTQGENDVVYTFEKSLGVVDTGLDQLRIENGILKWKVLDETNYKKTIIKVSFEDENNEQVSISIPVENMTRFEIDGVYQYHYYQFTDDKYKLDSTTDRYTELKDRIYRTQVGGETIEVVVEYKISVYTQGTIVGSRNILNSNYSNVVLTTRLSSVETDSIKSMDGILVWSDVENATSYEVVLIGTETYKFVVTDNVINFLDDGFNINAGEYAIQIKAIGVDKISSMWTGVVDATGFVQLDKVDSTRIAIDGDRIVWSEVENADAYKVVFAYTDISGNSVKLTPDPMTESYYTSPGGISGKFKITISAIGVGEGKKFNGQPIEFVSSTEAPMQVESFTYDENNHRFVIDVKDGEFLDGDKLLLRYDFTEYGPQENVDRGAQTIEIGYLQGLYEQIEGGYRYYYPITIMGDYKAVSVQVTRQGTLPSNAVQVRDIELNLFAYGAGTYDDVETEANEANPYRISSAEHLLNIASFPSANYEMIASVSLEGVNITERIATYGAIISETFSGVLNAGDGKFAISGFNAAAGQDVVDLTDVENFALFGNLTERIVNNVAMPAEIRNLTIGTKNIQLILRNTFANDVENMINLSMIATGAKNAIIDSVNVINAKIIVQSNSNKMLKNDVRIAGYFANADGGQITNSRLNLTVEMNMSFSGNVYVGGLVASASSTNIDACQIEFNLSSSKSNTIAYVGGVAAYYVGTMNKAASLNNTHVEITTIEVAAMYHGGLVGFARYTSVTDSSTEGIIKKYSIDYLTYIGGIIGCAQSSTIINSGTAITFNELVNGAYKDTISVVTIKDKYIGAIVGSISILNEVPAAITNCYMPANEELSEEEQLICKDKTNVTTSKITIGIYGDKNEKVTMTGCYIKVEET